MLVGQPELMVRLQFFMYFLAYVCNVITFFTGTKMTPGKMWPVMSECSRTLTSRLVFVTRTESCASAFVSCHLLCPASNLCGFV